LPCAEDIIAEVNNDILLSQLFAYRLKLAYAKQGNQSQNELKEAIKTKL